jgi:hypothetical protein
MLFVLLGHPLVLAYLLCVAVLLVAFFWPRRQQGRTECVRKRQAPTEIATGPRSGPAVDSSTPFPGGLSGRFAPVLARLRVNHGKGR